MNNTRRLKSWRGRLSRPGVLVLGWLILIAGCTQPTAGVSSAPPSPTTEEVPAPTLEPTAAPDPTRENTPAPAAVPVPETPAPDGAPLIARKPEEIQKAGRATYLQQQCGICHTLTKAGTHGTFGPTHDNLGATAAERILDPRYRGTATTPAEYVRESILQPGIFYVEGYQITRFRMPAYTNLSEEELNDLITFLMTP